ncbi:hypothetical protein Tco_1456497 [Tanacetum coccineum]
MGELTYFLGLLIKKDDKGISICQEPYTRNLLKKYEISDDSSMKTPMVTPNNLGSNLASKPVTETLYRGMICTQNLISKDTQTQTMLVAVWTEKAPQVNKARGAKDIVGILFWGVMNKRFGVITLWNICYDLKSLLSELKNGKKLLALDFKTFLNLLVLIITKATNVAHPSLEVVKAELAKITTSEALVQKNPILKTTFPVA